MLGVVGRGKITGHNAFRTGGVDHFAVANVNTHMGDTGAVCILQEYKITGLQIVFRHIGADLVLFGGGARH